MCENHKNVWVLLQLIWKLHRIDSTWLIIDPTYFSQNRPNMWLPLKSLLFYINSYACSNDYLVFESTWLFFPLHVVSKYIHVNSILFSKFLVWFWNSHMWFWNLHMLFRNLGMLIQVDFCLIVVSKLHMWFQNYTCCFETTLKNI